MEFLCPNHRRVFADLPLDEQKELWLLWMEGAFTRYECGDRQDVISLSGSAFDLACLSHRNHDQCMHIELTLSAILVFRALWDQGDHYGADQVLARALEQLQPDGLYGSDPDGCCGVGECMEVLLDTSMHRDFFADYLNWPTIPFAPQVAGHTRVLH